MKSTMALQGLVALLVGFLFSFGLAVAGMTDPAKVLGFLTWDKNWDPTLLFVMMGAIPVHAFIYYLARKRTSPLLDSRWHVPQSKQINRALVLGSLLFGLGWGLAGYCPGPVITSVGAGSMQALVFVAAMLVGMSAQRFFKYESK
ncbi:MAG: hypothetical protein OM95_03980 [Bdellovibrio sp. ArHS]|uniref:YeeE/YedE family protein n=1 Tax=Bdellovibrio sp. ArHS TaxID=1569284 RepID=UPI0005823DEA|nr:YeeE/YedE family protein [Bdellovibrio sp. ArHS]KHD89298.1 MAG: hypothetical protein OM95_03980 [Bdellovibrio sp. ArHS]